MRPLSDRDSPDSGSSVNRKNKPINTIVRWDTKVESFQQIDDLDVRYRIIDVANKKIRLSDVFRQYSIRFEETFSHSGWDYKASCPFPSHKGGRERTPSFYYNPKEGRFNCFGCTLAGRAVEFIAFMKRQNAFEIAQDILTQYGSLESAIEESNDSDTNIDQELFDFSVYVNDFIKTHKDDPRAVQYAENVLWGFDVYIAANIRKGIFAEEFSARTLKYKEAFECYGDENDVE